MNSCKQILFDGLLSCKKSGIKVVVNMAEQDHKTEKQFEEQIKEKSRRKIEARKQKDRGLWYGVGMFGLVGWSVAMPTLLFLALGIWIDSRYPSQYSWTLMLLVIGIAIGCINAWYWVSSESQQK